MFTAPIEELEFGKKDGCRREGGVGVIGIGDAPRDEEPDDKGDIDRGGIAVTEGSSSFLEECP
jgi:hypothetical protein